MMSTDLLVLDTACYDRSTSDPAASNLLRKLGLHSLEKIEGVPTQLSALKREFSRCENVIGSPGGSAFNILWTMQGLLRGYGEAAFLKANMLSCVGDDPHGKDLRQAAHAAGIKFIPEAGFPSAITPFSYVINHPPGHGNRRTIVKDIGNLRETLTLGRLPSDLFHQSDIFLLAGQMVQKIGAEVPDELLRQRWQQTGIDLWLTLPTDKLFGASHAAYFQSLISSAAVLLSNVGELKAVYEVHTSDEALTRVQQAFQQDILHREGRPPRQQQVAFITCGEDGAAIVSADTIIRIKTQSTQVLFELGSGDSASGAFLAATLLGYAHDVAGNLAMQVAAANLIQPEAQTALPVLMKLGAQLRYTEPLPPTGDRHTVSQPCELTA